MTSKVTYLGNLRTNSVHLKSGSEILSDAPLDNNGKGEAFSPTDTVANALASCILTVMGIKARDMGISMTDSVAEVTKHMQSDPRRIAKIEVTITMQCDADEKAKIILERTALACPVYQSLHPDIEKVITFNW
ncbi:OsmC family protein [Flavobacterium litorale]|uniref:OsmC family protein n=1 Tax=Flavobacterium litorale TaxID=2856519 RepID=A0ABX8VAC9_9FLAO|nr:OsmC family protein [Flavobacterium litorale]QYJ68143.1 OsmC family protein [Flavobacterium litorale]